MTTYYCTSGIRKHYRSPAQMRETAHVLRNPDPAELARLGMTPTPSWGESAALLEQEAARWEGERRDTRNAARRAARVSKRGGRHG
jgi:hypothetical protein